MENNLIERTVTYHLPREERETLYRYSDGDTYCICDTSIGKDVRKLISKGWLMVSCDKYADGTYAAAKFTCPVELLSPRAFKPSKPKRTISEEHKSKMQSARKNIAT